ncbi:acyl-CoA thioesterase [Neorhizobium petrolearium]|uniref:Thioesterase family protein n=1 Tax=Neorhizobium petrolearium TaxID=515361 RepID=A0ABY8LZG8_9HYPH|nr:thioesterase family protein [Neorhizobium petrolearium]MCC2612596.1 acyl-CoA thioesterase [Neorhizobium petrolearium]WGI67720.1 thioesterase family protein [Neorhizobium petrolearium]
MAYTISRRLNFGDCDPSGIAYFPSYLDILVGAYEEFFRAIGFPWPELINERKIGLPTVTLDLTFKSPGFHGDMMDFTIKVMRIGTSSVDLEHEVRAGDRLLWTAKQRLVATSLETHKACPWPDDMRTALTQHLEKNDAHDSAA